MGTTPLSLPEIQTNVQFYNDGLHLSQRPSWLHKVSDDFPFHEQRWLLTHREVPTVRGLWVSIHRKPPRFLDNGGTYCSGRPSRIKTTVLGYQCARTETSIYSPVRSRLAHLPRTLARGEPIHEGGHQNSAPQTTAVTPPLTLQEEGGRAFQRRRSAEREPT